MNRADAIALSLLISAFPVSARAKTTRIVSLMPSLTEDLFALGAGSDVIATSQFTTYPPAAASLPQVASATNVDAERIVALAPDVVVGIPAQAAATQSLVRAGVRVVLLPDDTIADIYATLTQLGALCGRTHEAALLTARMRRETDALRREAVRWKPTVFVVLDVKPIFTAGASSYIAGLIGLAGGVNAAHLRAAYGRYSPEALLAQQPDVIVADSLIHIRSVIGEEPWRSLRAVAAGNLAEFSDADAVSQPGPRYNTGLRWLIDVLRRAQKL